MMVVGWNNGSPNNETGAGYGVRIKREDRNKYFLKEWLSITIELGKGDVVEIRLSDSFWRNCIELRSAKIGKWLLSNKLAPWPQGKPPTLGLELVGDRNFRLSLRGKSDD
jgi:hypothetical protein